MAGKIEYARALTLADLHPLITERLAMSIAAGDVPRHLLTAIPSAGLPLTGTVCWWVFVAATS